jgi:hypothetical protein
MSDETTQLPSGPAGALVAYVCVDAEHVRIGRGRPDGTGHLTVHRGKWAYCSAALPNTEHDWVPTGGVPLEQIRHDQISATTEG